MSHTITLLPSGQQFRTGDAEPILFSAIAAHVSVPYGCRGGVCGVCRARVVEGRFTGGLGASAAAGDAAEAGEVLLCTAFAASNMAIECREVADTQPVRNFPARIESIDHPAADVARVRLRVPGRARLTYAAGQYVEVLLPGGQVRNYSLASPCDPASRLIELHVRHVPGGLFSGRFFGELAPGDVLHLRAPHGLFTLAPDGERPAILVVTGTGFAPAKAAIEVARAAGSRRSMRLYWGGRQRQDIYMEALCRSWEQALDFRFVPVLSGAGAAWEGRRGYVQEAVLADVPDLSGHEVFACGSPAMVEAARSAFLRRGGLPSAHFHADSFLTQADLQGRREPAAMET